jgi:hypothetical protein
MKKPIRITGAKEIMRALEQAGQRGRKIAAAAVYQEAERVMSDSEQEVAVGVDGVLRTSGFVKLPTDRGGKIQVELGYGGAAKGYAVYVHEGTGPAVGKPAYMPPSDALKPWVKKKMGVPESEVDNVAFLVARKIGRTGTEPTKYLERPLRKRAKGMGQRIASRIRAGLGG